MNKFLLHILYIALPIIAFIAGGFTPASAQKKKGKDVDLGKVLQATRQAESEARSYTADVLGGIAGSMRTQQRTQRAQAQEDVQELDGIAAAMRSQQAAASGNQSLSASGDGSFYRGDIEYTTYGKDSRADIAAGMNGRQHVNPYIMGDYTVAGTYAAPGALPYIQRNAGTRRAPVRGRITSGFGYRPQFGRMHHGVDLSLRTGDTVRAAYSGKVVRVGYDADGYGRYVKLRHDNGMETLYAHLSAPTVVYGQNLRAGQPLGIGGATGNATGPHLHFETRINGIAVDPENYFNFGNGKASTGKLHNPLSDNGRRIVTPKKESAPKKEQTKRRSRPHLKTQTVATAAGKQSGKQPRTGSYQVKRGETIQKIARDHGMTVGELCRINKMSPYTPMYKGKVIRLK